MQLTQEADTAFKLSDDFKKIVISDDLPNLWQFYEIALEVRSNEPLRRYILKTDPNMEVDTLLFVGGIGFEGVPNAPEPTGRGFLVLTSDGNVLAIPFNEFIEDYRLG